MVPAPPVVSLRARITGRVQGVWFRAWTQDRARALGIEGWARNLADGSVEAVFVGPEPAVAELVAACADGPPLAQVANVATEAAPGEETEARGRGFRVL